MTKEELRAFLSSTFDLVADLIERGSALTYFLGKVVWHPSTTTRILHVQYSANGHVSHIKLSVSSANNNSVFVQLPVSWLALQIAVANEILLHVRNRPLSA